MQIGSECLESVFNGGDAGFDLVIIDSHLNDMPGMEVARKIKERLPDQKIVITTTSMVKDVEGGDWRGNNKAVQLFEIARPDKFSKLLALIKPSTA